MAASGSNLELGGQGQEYRCFLVRCRLEDSADRSSVSAGQRAWRFTVVQMGGDPARRSFICLRDVAAYLDAELTSCGPLDEKDPVSIPSYLLAPARTMAI